MRCVDVWAESFLFETTRPVQHWKKTIYISSVIYVWYVYTFYCWRIWKYMPWAVWTYILVHRSPPHCSLHDWISTHRGLPKTFYLAYIFCVHIEILLKPLFKLTLLWRSHFVRTIFDLFSSPPDELLWAPARATACTLCRFTIHRR